MAGITIDAETFGKRAKLLYDNWRTNRATLWDNANILAIPVGGSSEDLRYLKSISLHLWLFGYELPDTIVVFLDEALHILTSGKKASLLEPLAAAASSKLGVTLQLHTRAKGEDGSSQIDAILAAMQAVPDPRVGLLHKEKHSGALVELWSSKLQQAGLPTADIQTGLSDVLAVKDAEEVLNVKKAAMLGAKIMGGFVVQKLEETIDKEKKIKHSRLSELTEEVIMEPAKAQIKLKPENVDIAYQPIFQSGGSYDLKVSAASDDSQLHAGVILVSIGTRYSSYCANVSRTYMIDPSKEQEAQYAAVLAAQEAAVAALKDGAPANTAYEAAVKTLQDKGQPALAERLSKNIGFGMGLEFRDSHSMLNAKNTHPVKAGMVFNVAIGISGLENPAASSERSRVYALQVADTVLVQPGGQPPAVLTTQAPKDWDKISYILDNPEESEGEDLQEQAEPNLAAGKKLRSDDPNYKSAEQLRKEKQEELLKRKNAETLARLTAAQNGGAGGAAGAGVRLISSVNAYRSPADIPAIRELQVAVDGQREAVLLPIYGIMVPVHIMAVKTATANVENDTALIRISFNFGGAYEPAQRYPDLVFLKDLSFRTLDVKHATKVVQDIKLLRSSVLQKEKERVERASLVEQEKLLVSMKRVFRLGDLFIRPHFGGKGRKMTGKLEAHPNGFRYYTPRNETVDVMYRNIRHAFFQPAEKEMITILHFHLHNPIMIGNKKTKDVQFYVELAEATQAVDNARRNMYDPDEIEEEQRERDKRNKINSDCSQFVKKVQELWEKDFPNLGLEFDIPFRELAFDGVPARSTVTMMPTVNCLVELTEWPPVVVSLSDIEIVNLERVGFNLKNFDMTIVFKDYQRDVLRIDAIPTSRLDTIKEWLTSCTIKYFESKMNLSWKPILKKIMEDPEGFVEEGGWDFLNMDKSDDEDEEGEGEEHSEEYDPGSEAGSVEESSDADSSEDESLVSEDDEDEDGGDEDEDSEGMDWDELEEEARREDRRRDEMAEDSDDDRHRKRKGGAGGGSSSGAAAKRRR